jgi:hypothetical protein
MQHSMWRHGDPVTLPLWDRGRGITTRAHKTSTRSEWKRRVSGAPVGSRLSAVYRHVIDCLPYLGCALGRRPLRRASDSLCDCGLCGSGSTACAWMWTCACQWRVRGWGRSARCDIQGVCRGVSNPAMRACPWFVMGRSGPVLRPHETGSDSTSPGQRPRAAIDAGCD